jgi:hypothetical protein
LKDDVDDDVASMSLLQSHMNLGFNALEKSSAVPASTVLAKEAANPLASAKLLQTEHASEREERSDSTQFLASTGSLAMLVVTGNRALQLMASEAAFQFLLVLLLVIVGCVLVQSLLMQRRSGNEWSSAAAMLPRDPKSFPSPLQDNRLPPTEFSGMQPTGFSGSPQMSALPAPASASSVAQPPATSMGSFFSSFVQNFSSPREEQVKLPTPKQDMRWGTNIATSEHLCPMMRVHEAQGIQLSIHGPLLPDMQQGVLEVKAITSDPRQEVKMQILLSEQGDKDGVSIALPQLTTGAGGMSVAFLDTTYCAQRSSNGGYVLIYQCLKERGHIAMDLFNLFAVAQMEREGGTGKGVIRRPGLTPQRPGEVLYYVTSTGYNTDDANIMDSNYRLIATSSTRGRPSNVRSLQIYQDVDSVMMVAALIATIKLNRR